MAANSRAISSSVTLARSSSCSWASTASTARLSAKALKAMRSAALGSRSMAVASATPARYCRRSSRLSPASGWTSSRRAALRVLRFFSLLSIDMTVLGSVGR
ncbi:hypothetical protein D3C84_1072890 [compost metagenome]